MSEARKHLETEVKAAKYLKESTIAVSVDHLDTLLKASPPSGGEVVYQQRTFGNRHETWRDIPKHEYDQLVLPSNGRILYPSPMVVDDDMLDAACEAYADMYDVEYIDGGNRDNRRACIKAALQAALELNR